VESCHQRAAVQQWISPRKRSPDWRRRILRPVAPAGPTRIRKRHDPQARPTAMELSIIEMITAYTAPPRRHARHSCLGGFR